MHTVGGSVWQAGTAPGSVGLCQVPQPQPLFVYDNMGAIKRLPHYVILGMVV